MIGTVKNVRFTHGAFGEQYWTIIDEKGVDHCFAMWEDCRSEKWAEIGKKVEIRRMGDRKISFGGGGYIRISNTAEIVRVIREPVLVFDI